MLISLLSIFFPFTCSVSDNMNKTEVYSKLPVIGIILAIFNKCIDVPNGF